MDENSTLESLSRSWKQKSEQERKRLEQIEKEKLQDLSESLRESMSQELQKIENDMTARLKNLRDKMTEARQKIVADEKATLNTLRENRAEIEDEALTLFETLNKVKARYWITPLIVGLTLTIGLGLGLWGLGAVISDRSQTLQALNEEITQAQQSRDHANKWHLIAKTYNNGVELKRKPEVWQLDNGNWVVQFEPIKE